MVALPSVPRRLVTTEAPQSTLTRADILSPYASLGRAMDEAGQTLEAFAIPAAEDAGLTAVSIDADGLPRVERPTIPIVGKAGAAFERAARVAGLAKADGAADRALMEMREQFRTNPKGFQAAADAYREKQVKTWGQALGPQVAVNLDKAIANNANQIFRGLRNEVQRLELSSYVDSMQTRIEEAESIAGILTRGGADKDSPELKAAINTVHALRLELSQNPLITYSPDRARVDIDRFNADLMIARKARLITGSDGVYETEGYPAALQAAETVRTDASINLTPAQREAAYQRVVADVNARRRIDEFEVRQFSTQFQSIEKLASEGLVVPPQHIAALRAQVERTGNPTLAERMRQTDAIVEFTENARRSSIPDLERTVAKLDRDPSAETIPELRAQKIIATNLLRTMRKEVAANALTWADRVGVQEVPPIQFDQPDAPIMMQDRIARAENVARYYNRPVQYLRPEEAENIELITARGGPDMLGLARNIAAGFGDRAPAVFAEVSKQAPVLAHMGVLLASNSSSSVVPDAAEAVRLQTDPQFKPPRWLDKPTEKIRTAQSDATRRIYGSAFIGAPDTGRAAEATGRAAFFTRATRHGYEPLLESSEAKTAYDKAMQEAAGARYTTGGAQFGGIGNYRIGFWNTQKVLVPTDVRADRFRDVITAIRDEDLAALPVPPQSADGKPYAARDLHGAIPVAVRGGYQFATKDPSSDDPRYIRGADGQPFVLPFDRMNMLRQRVPAAFGGQ